MDTIVRFGSEPKILAWVKEREKGKVNMQKVAVKQLLHGWW